MEKILRNNIGKEPRGVSPYNLDQWKSFKAIVEAMAVMDERERLGLQEMCRPYLCFREELDLFHKGHVEAHCTGACYEKGVSACCGFESIFTFFADQVVNVLFSSPEELAFLLATLRKPNTTRRCVYLGPAGCLWKVRPISCAMFFCDDVKQNFLQADPVLEREWKEKQREEKAFTWPDRQVLFDDLEKCFLARSVDSPFMYFHKSPGLLRVKAQARKNQAEKGEPFAEVTSRSTAK